MSSVVGDGAGTARIGVSEQAETVDEARRQIDQTRRALGETVHALAAKTDVKAQARRTLAPLARPQVVGGLVLVTVALVAVRHGLRHRGRRHR